MSERVSPQHCPYCGGEDLRPHSDAHGTWECRACARAFSVKFLGLVARSASGSPASVPSGPAPSGLASSGLAPSGLAPSGSEASR